MSAIKRFFALILVLVIAATVAFIFYNSSLPPEKSSEQSGAIGGVLAEIIPPETELGGFLQKYLRKIAHFTEYGLLGIELALMCVFFIKHKIAFALGSLFFAGTVALVDETVQIFSERGPTVSDIWIDIGGFLFFSALAYLVLALIKFVAFIIRRRRVAGRQPYPLDIRSSLKK